MLTSRWRPVVICGIAIVAIWIVALTGLSISKNSRMTADKVRAYVESENLGTLSAAERARALGTLAEKFNALSVEERRRAQLERVAKTWLDQMTEVERARFLEATMPAGFKQMLTSFQQLPDEKKRQTIADAMRRLRETAARIQTEDGAAQIPITPPPVNAEVQAKIRSMGLEAFYTQSSAQFRVEVAPVLEELQRVMESGRPFRGR